MKFLKPHLSVMLKLFGNQIIISLLSNMLYGTLYDIPILLTIGMVLALGIYYYMQYRVIWEHACRESIRPREQQQHIGPVTGLVVALCASLPSLIVNLVPVLSPMHVTELGGLSGGLPQLCYTLGKFFFNGQYIAIIQSFFPMQILDVQNTALAAQNAASIIASVPYYLLTVLPLMLVGWFAYWLGLKDRTIPALLGIEHLFVAKKKKETQAPTLKK